MILVSFNVNGIRSLTDYYQTCNNWSFTELLCKLSPKPGIVPHFICMQETKANDSSRLANIHLHPQSPFKSALFAFPRRPKRIGHAGVAIYSQPRPTSHTDSLISFLAEDSFPDSNVLKKLDGEGRFLMAAFGDDMCIVNVYCPSLHSEDGDDVRQVERKVFFQSLQLVAAKLAGMYKYVFIVGDFNVTPAPIDHCDYASHGHTDLFYDADPIRKWFSKWMIEDGIVDCFRLVHPTSLKRYTCWNTLVSARVGNHGTRLDSILLKSRSSDVIVDCDQMNDFKGSDHCPVWVDIDGRRVAICEGQGRSIQSRLTDFVTKRLDANAGTERAAKRPKKMSLLDFGFVRQDADSSTVDKRPAHIDGRPCSPDVTAGLDNPRRATESSTLDGPCGQAHADSGCESDGSCARAVDQSEKWNSIFKSPKVIPTCTEHQKRCVMLRVNKKGPNNGRYFYICSVPIPDRCDFFAWRNA